jgi:hypothetical protein
LQWNDSLAEAAKIRAIECTVSYSHLRLDGSEPFTVFSEVGIGDTAAAENIASGYRTPEDAVIGWMNSDGHKENTLNPAYNSIGVGVASNADGEYFWVQLFADLPQASKIYISAQNLPHSYDRYGDEEEFHSPFQVTMDPALLLDEGAEYGNTYEITISMNYVTNSGELHTTQETSSHVVAGDKVTGFILTAIEPDCYILLEDVIDFNVE